jgi:hypothetical protein
MVSKTTAIGLGLLAGGATAALLAFTVLKPKTTVASVGIEVDDLTSGATANALAGEQGLSITVSKSTDTVAVKGYIYSTTGVIAEAGHSITVYSLPPGQPTLPQYIFGTISTNQDGFFYMEKVMSTFTFGLGQYYIVAVADNSVASPIITMNLVA